MPPPGQPPGEFKLVYILNLESVTILFNIEEQAQANSMNHKTAVNVTKKVCHVTKKLALSPFCLHKKSHEFCFEAALREPYPVGKQL